MKNNKLSTLKVQVFADGADLESIIKLNTNPLVKGFTTNPTLMRKAGVTDYKSFALKVIQHITDKPISFEVFADDLDTMYAQAREIASWGHNVNVKIPVTNTEGEFTGPIISRLSKEGVQLNITAIMTAEQVDMVAACLDPNTPAIISIFAGRIADTGRDPIPVMRQAQEYLLGHPYARLLWASAREVFNVYQADEINCDIITITNDLLGKLELADKNLDDFSLETVAMFYKDACQAGYTIDTKVRVLPKWTTIEQPAKMEIKS